MERSPATSCSCGTRAGELAFSEIGAGSRASYGDPAGRSAWSPSIVPEIFEYCEDSEKPKGGRPKICRVLGWILSGCMPGNSGYPTWTSKVESITYMSNVGFVGFL